MKAGSAPSAVGAPRAAVGVRPSFACRQGSGDDAGRLLLCTACAPLSVLRAHALASSLFSQSTA